MHFHEYITLIFTVTSQVGMIFPCWQVKKPKLKYYELLRFQIQLNLALKTLILQVSYNTSLKTNIPGNTSREFLSVNILM